MYFRNYRPRKTSLDNCLKTPVWEDLSPGDMVNGRNTASILMRAPLSSWVITVNKMELQKSLLDTWKFFRRFLNTLTANDKYSLISRDKWMQTIQMHLSKKQKTFSEFFSAFSESAFNFKHFQKKITLIVYVFPKLPTTKYLLRSMSKNSRLKGPLDNRHGKQAETLIQS